MNRTVIIPSAGIGNIVAAYTIGFVRLEIRDRIEDALGAGSGTLVKIGKVVGVLTAAHVLENLPDQGLVGIVEYLADSIHYRKQTIDMAGASKITLRGPTFGIDGPDLGFLRLPSESVGWLTAINSFYNLLKHRSDVSTPAPTSHAVDAIIGMIDERTKYLPAERANERRKGFEALLSNGTISAIREANQFDLIDFVPTEYPDFKLPDNYQGTSGGALWRLFLKFKDDAPEIVAAQLWGIPFYQTKSADGSHTLTCHGMRGVYGPLLESIIARWPDEATVE